MASTHSAVPPPERVAARDARSAQNAWSGVLFGVGLIAFCDEAVFHQLLHWHHFYDRSTPDVGLVSDGVFHAISWFATIAGLFLFADLRRRGALSPLRWWGGVLVGAGAFQLYDGTIQHKVLGLHQIRYVPNLLVYDLIWNITAALMLAAGIIVLVYTRRRAPSAK
ncbi:putative membrane protein [Okibacterium sp. HSC-33S16]|uniref:DUF2243 domain-containing protein n=1 Tax=Okibacterium sp. HSC-33S16 TaxID=2910965 RepID=UPI00209FCB8E|nr:DUF2243 domain-containing protein [Okibacterium sp. HSC-33S16]MCP2032970.1 putative membrane protein [Okibacterium sp. HSC-33S16]